MGQVGFTLWLTGLSGAGKSTLAHALNAAFVRQGRPVEVLDGDEVRRTFCRGLGYSKEDRDTNVRRIGFVARLLSRNGVVAIVAAISPYRDIRDEIRRQHEVPFVEILVDCPLTVLVGRDQKGLYAKALRGELDHFTGISDPYEPPESPDFIIRTHEQTVPESCAVVLDGLASRGIMAAPIDDRCSSMVRDSLMFGHGRAGR